MADVDDRWYKTGPDGRRQRTARYGTGKRWQARWRNAEGRQRYRAFERKLDAERFLAGLCADLMRGSYVDPRDGKVTLRAYAEQRWLPAQVHLRPNSASTYASHVANHVVPLLGDRPLGSLRRPDCTAFVAALTASLAPSTVHTVYAVLRSLMQSAVEDQVIAANPCARVPLPRLDKRVVVPMTAAAVSALAASMPARYEVAVWLAAGAGLREGEALGLTVPRVQFLARRVVVVEQMQNRSLSPLKTKASTRVVPVDDLVLTAVTEHMRRWQSGPSELLITNRLGKPVQRNSFGHCWREAVSAAGLAPGTRFHDLRHFYASTLIAAGLHPKAIQARLGHATIAETMDTYGHLFPDADDLGRGVIDAAFGDARPMCARCVPDANPERLDAGQRTGGGRVSL
jgi:integrase